jgi:uncharacterized protein RhaS with RHS repeats
VDPVQDGNNWYAYVNNDPVNFVDPNGLSASELPDGWRSKENKDGSTTYFAPDNRNLIDRIFGKPDDIAQFGITVNQKSGEVRLPEVDTGGSDFLAMIGPAGPEKAATKTLEALSNILKPEGKLIGKALSSPKIRGLTGSTDEASQLYERLAKLGEPVDAASLAKPYPGSLVDLPGGGRVGFRSVSSSGPPTIDIMGVKGLGIREIKFLP